MTGEPTAEAFDEFFRATRPNLIGQAFLLVGDEALAQDLVQEAMSRAWLNWRRVGRLDNPGAWTRRVMCNLAMSEFRRERLRRKHSTVDGARVPPPEVEALDLAAALQTLPPRRRRALVLHDVAGVPIDEIASGLKVPAGTVRSWLSRDRAALAERLGYDSQSPKGRDSHDELR